MITLSLPHPISANRYWRTYNNRVVRSVEANDYRRTVQHIGRKLVPVEGAVHLHITYHPRMRKDGGASKTRLDVSNTVKVVEDCLQGLAYHDDKQVTELHACLGYPVAGGGVTVRICSAPVTIEVM